MATVWFGGRQILLLLLLLMGSAVLQLNSTGLFVSVTQNRQLVSQGADLRVDCHFNATPDYVLWYFNGDTELVAQCHPKSNQCRLYSSWKNVKAFPNFTLSVENITADQDGLFKCEGMLQSFIASTTVTVTVVVDPGPPVISLSPSSLTDGDTATLTCSSSGANPLVRLSWLLTPKAAPTTNLTDNVVEETLPTVKFGESKTIVRLRVTAMHHGATVQCTATQAETGEKRADKIMLRVKHKPSVQKQNNITTIEGYTVTIGCVATGYPTPQLMLAKPNGSVMPGKGGTGLFTMSGMSRTDAGMYTCIGSNSLGNSSSAFDIRVLHPPNANAPEEVTVKEGEPVTLPCFVTGDPMPTDIVWFHGVTGDRPARNGTNLTLPSARVEQAGLWRCDVRVRLTPSRGASVDYTASASVRLRVLYRPDAPTATQPLAPVSSGQRVTFNCSANRVRPGYPPPSLLWSRDDEEEAEEGEGEDLSADEETGQLVLPTATLQNSGAYFCRARNELGVSQSAARVSLRVVQAPRIVDRPASRDQPIRARAGDAEFTLTCTVAASPQPKMRWLRQGRPLTDNDQFLQQLRPAQQSHHYSLILHFRGNNRLSVSLNDTGSFTCEASNSLGSDSTNYTLEVTTPPKIVNRLHKVALISGDRLTCQFHSHAGFTVAWRRAGDANWLPGNWSVSTSPEAPHLHSSTGPNGVGNFTCSVTNSLGADSANFTVVTESLPDPPTSVKVTSVDWDSFDVVWLPGFNGGHTTRLRLSVTGWNASASTEVTASYEMNAAAGAWTVNGLFPDTTYRLRMRARNSLGEGDASPELHIVTKHLTLPEVTEPLWQPRSGSFAFKGTEGHCALVQVSEDSGATWRTLTPCLTYSSEGHALNVEDTTSLYRVALCLESRPEICGTAYTTYSVAKVATVSFELIAGVAGACAALIVVLTVVLLCLCCRRRYNRSDEEEKKDKSGVLQTRAPPPPPSGCHSLPRYHQNHHHHHQHHRPSIAYVSPTVTENLSSQTQDTHETCLDGSNSDGNNPPSPLLQTPTYAPLQVFPTSFYESDGATDRSNDSPPSPARLRRVVYEVVV